ncbi:DNA alkylation repair protein [Streptococcus shenyangsis]|uniref:DNA alkylation repair protein n=1 Tax=Streptococcus shenyangsis TaxID=2589786 RepID=A0ABY2YK69_9STRE|nr:DNA alkylation repair protein [Streptococcus shenyangsis]TPE39756.1 DNA alkylation repair protein [Streptococcus sp. D2]
MNQRRVTSYLILFENLFKPRQLYLQPQNSALSSLRLAF